jgi:hypothetical protein
MAVFHNPLNDDHPGTTSVPGGNPDEALKWTKAVAIGTIAGAIATFILALITGSLAFLGYLQGKMANSQIEAMSRTNETMNNQLRAMQQNNTLVEGEIRQMQRSNEIQSNSSYNVQRPYVYFAIPPNIYFDNGRSLWIIPIQIGNAGSTPTRNLTYRMSCGSGSNDTFAFFPGLHDSILSISRHIKVKIFRYLIVR